ncbi:unnamed protein product [Lactuca virosa]|uniref:Uncharacterized protein n=1 Tax=Lactuca virosa TaxID=75947 RepID=A0AAU9LKM1_9ASTR|nr:unnamed protein product [Lactuca virosa]
MHPTSSCHQEEKAVTGEEREATKGTMRTSGEAGKSWNVAVTSQKLPLLRYTTVYDRRRRHQGLVTIGMHLTSSCHQEEKAVTGEDREATKGTMRTSGEARKSWNVAVTSQKLPLLRFVAATPP